MIKCSEEEFGSSSSSYIAIEWDPTTLHLRYQSSQEKISTEHESVERSRKQQTEPIDLYECFRAFTKEEELGEDELWYVTQALENNSCFLLKDNVKIYGKQLYYGANLRREGSRDSALDLKQNTQQTWCEAYFLKLCFRQV